jgi:hypothetical protein
MFQLNPKVLAVLATVIAALAVSYQADAASRDGRMGGAPPPHMHLDARFAHNQVYHDRGFAMPGVPRGAYTIHRGRDTYFYHGGEWYRPNGRFSVVIGAPIGAFVPVLPPFYSTVWWDGVPYYYADDAYYTWDAEQNEYQVVSPPSGIESGGTTTAPLDDTIFVYPKNGQSAEQQSQDRYECHRSAVLATGYDPTAPNTAMPSDTSADKRADYMRAQEACLDARGYSVK